MLLSLLSLRLVFLSWVKSPLDSPSLLRFSRVRSAKILSASRRAPKVFSVCSAVVPAFGVFSVALHLGLWKEMGLGCFSSSLGLFSRVAALFLWERYHPLAPHKSRSFSDNHPLRFSQGQLRFYSPYIRSHLPRLCYFPSASFRRSSTACYWSCSPCHGCRLILRVFLLSPSFSSALSASFAVRCSR